MSPDNVDPNLWVNKPEVLLARIEGTQIRCATCNSTARAYDKRQHNCRREPTADQNIQKNDPPFCTAWYPDEEYIAEKRNHR